MSKHSPGPWIASIAFADDTSGDTTLHIENDQRPLVEVYEPDEPESFANARLIAAAPSLLAACEAIVDHPAHAVDLAMDAIREAIGDSNE